MPGQTTSKCRNDKCRKPVVWGTSPKGAVTPYDPDPVPPEKAPGFRVLYKLAVPHGDHVRNDRLRPMDPNDMVSVGPLEYAVAAAEGTPLFSSHFQTCAFAGEFSRRDR